jgi:hypothetical protein
MPNIRFGNRLVEKITIGCSALSVTVAVNEQKPAFLLVLLVLEAITTNMKVDEKAIVQTFLFRQGLRRLHFIYQPTLTTEQNY